MPIGNEANVDPLMVALIAASDELRDVQDQYSRANTSRDELLADQADGASISTAVIDQHYTDLVNAVDISAANTAVTVVENIYLDTNPV